MADSKQSSGWYMPDGSPRADGGPQVTVTFRRELDAERVGPFLEWQQGITAANRQFDGFLSAAVLREPLAEHRRVLFVVILSYRDYASARAWHTSKQRQEWLARLGDLDLGPDDEEEVLMDARPDGLPMFSGLLSMRGDAVRVRPVASAPQCSQRAHACVCR
jgi:quinol monooxygenase YgiN